MKRWIVAAAAGMLVGLAAAAPLMGEAGLGVYAGFSWVCHQRPERSWQLGGKAMAVCVRCLGLYSGALLGALAGLGFRKRAAGAALAMIGLDWAIELAGLAGSRPAWRFALGVLAGALAAPALWPEPRARVLRRN